jgi:hypothetical protein
MNKRRSRVKFAGVIALAFWAGSVTPLAADDSSLAGKLRNLFGRGKAESQQAEGGVRSAERQKRGPTPKSSGAIQQVSATSPIPSPRTLQSVSSSQPLTPATWDSEALEHHRSSLTLDALEQLASENNPTLAQTAAIVEAARGRQIQSALGRETRTRPVRGSQDYSFAGANGGAEVAIQRRRAYNANAHHFCGKMVLRETFHRKRNAKPTLVK